MDANLHKMVEARARAIWEEAGCPEGADLLHWMQAECELGIVGQVDGSEPADRVDFDQLKNDQAADASADGTSKWPSPESGHTIGQSPLRRPCVRPHTHTQPLGLGRP